MCGRPAIGAEKPPSDRCLTLAAAAGFRVALTGTALELDAKFEVVKKLKLVGYPDKIFKKTAFIKGMFNSDLEVKTSFSRQPRTDRDCAFQGRYIYK